MARETYQICDPGSVSYFLDKLFNFPGKEIRFVNVGDRQSLEICVEVWHLRIAMDKTMRLMSRSKRDLHYPMRSMLKRLIIKVHYIEVSRIHSKYLVDEIDEAKPSARL